MSRRLTLFSVLLGVTAAVAVAVILVSSSGSEPAPTPDVTAILRGIPQDRLTLGNPDAPVLIVEFVDLQCPYCRYFVGASWPDLIQRYVRTGKVKMELRLSAFLGEGSVRASKAVMAAGLQNRMWDAALRFYDHPGEDNIRYVTERYVRDVLSGVRGLDLARALKERRSAAVSDQIGEVYAMQRRYGVSSAPWVMIGTDDTDLTMVTRGRASHDLVVQAIDQALSKKGLTSSSRG